MHKKHTVPQAQKAMFYVLKRPRELELPIDLQLKLFDLLVLPILLCGCEIWGFKNIEILEKLYLNFFFFICLKPSTRTCMVLGESGRFPLISLFWLKPGWSHFGQNEKKNYPASYIIFYIHFMSIMYIHPNGYHISACLTIQVSRLYGYYRIRLKWPQFL